MCLRSVQLAGDLERKSSGKWSSVSAGHPVQTESKGLVVQRLARGLISLSSVFVSARPLSEGHERALLFCVHETNPLQQSTLSLSLPPSLSFSLSASVVLLSAFLLQQREGSSIYHSVQVASINIDVTFFLCAMIQIFLFI